MKFLVIRKPRMGGALEAALTVFLVMLTIPATAGSALAATETALVTVSSTNPYATCSNTGQPGTVTLDAEVESQIAVNPHLSGNIIGVWQQDSWSNGGAHGLLAGFSNDNGLTWSESVLPFTACVTGGRVGPVHRDAIQQSLGSLGLLRA